MGLARQEEHLKLEQARLRIHADIIPPVSSIDLLSDKDISEALSSRVPRVAQAYPDVCAKVASWGFYLRQGAAKLFGEKEGVFRKVLKVTPEELKDPEFIKRNQIVEKKLLELIDANEQDKFAVVYGAAHQPIFEKFLLEHGFVLMKMEWVKLTSLD